MTMLEYKSLLEEDKKVNLRSHKSQSPEAKLLFKYYKVLHRLTLLYDSVLLNACGTDAKVTIFLLDCEKVEKGLSESQNDP